MVVPVLRGARRRDARRPAPDRRSTTNEGRYVTQVTQRTERHDEDLVRVYLDEIGRHELLTKDDEARLAQDIDAGRAARAKLDEAGRVKRSERRALEEIGRAHV